MSAEAAAAEDVEPSNSTKRQKQHHVCPQFITGDFTPQKIFLPDREYGLALDALVKACSDILVLSADGERVLLGKRKVEPQPDWWFIGGRAKPGDTTRAAASRNVKRELGLDLPVTRYSVIATYSYVWQFRQQAPAGNGTADIGTVHRLQLTSEEEQAVVLDEKEYSDSAFVAFADVLANDYHPCLKQAVRDLLKQRALDALCGAVEAASGDSDVAIAARAYVAAHSTTVVEEETTKVRFEEGAYVYVDPNA